MLRKIEQLDGSSAAQRAAIAAVGQLAEIAADRLDRDVEARREVLDDDLAFAARDFQYVGLPKAVGHATLPAVLKHVRWRPARQVLRHVEGGVRRARHGRAAETRRAAARCSHSAHGRGA